MIMKVAAAQSIYSNYKQNIKYPAKAGLIKPDKNPKKSFASILESTMQSNRTEPQEDRLPANGDGFSGMSKKIPPG
jgi:metal-dependent amidase/aminoacylase/carboxypeptidase family protein